jgi:DNA-3-methyladenine glycosylase II
VVWCCKDAAAVGPEPGVFFLPASAAGDVPELARALGSLGRVARFRNPSLWDAVGTAIIRQVVRAAQAQAQYRALCAAHGTPVRCGKMTGWLFPSPETVLGLGDGSAAIAPRTCG